MCANDCKDSVIYRISHLGMHSGTLTAVETAVVSLSPRVYTKTGKAKIGDGSGIRFGAGGTGFILIRVPPTTKRIILSDVLAYVLHEYSVFV